MRSLFAAAAASALIACASKQAGPPAPTQCHPATERTGTYLVTFTVESGNCGPVPSSLVSLNPGPSGAGTGCVLHSERFRDGDCTIERDETCPSSAGPIRTVAVSHQETQSGSELTGTATFTIDGPAPCAGTYALDAVRQ